MNHETVITCEMDLQRLLKIVDSSEIYGHKITIEAIAKKRTQSQNKAMHTYFEMLAEGLNDGGFDVATILSLKEAATPWHKDIVKAGLWFGIMEAMTGKTSTGDLDTAEVSRIYEVLNRHIMEKCHGLHVPFPSNR